MRLFEPTGISTTVLLLLYQTKAGVLEISQDYGSAEVSSYTEWWLIIPRNRNVYHWHWDDFIRPECAGLIRSDCPIPLTNFQTEDVKRTQEFLADLVDGYLWEN